MTADELAQSLANDPRLQHLFIDSTTAPAVEAAVNFFARGQPSPNRRWYGSVTWTHVMKVFMELAALEESAWRSTNSNDHTSLRTGEHQLQRGDVVVIESEGKPRFVTNTMGNPPNCHALFAGQVSGEDKIPQGPQRWRVVASPPSSQPVGASPPLPQPVEDPITLPGRTRSLRERIVQHPVASIAILLVSIVTALGSLTDSLDRIILFIKKHFGW